jgi:hypothetical protein
MDAVTQYVENNAQVVKLHKEMQECDAVLARMQDMLLSFQADLGRISHHDSSCSNNRSHSFDNEFLLMILKPMNQYVNKISFNSITKNS